MPLLNAIIENRLIDKLRLFSKDELIEIILIYNNNADNQNDVVKFENDINEYLIEKMIDEQK